MLLYFIIITMLPKENTIISNLHILLCVGEKETPELENLKNNFCGVVVTEICDVFKLENTNDRILYACRQYELKGLEFKMKYVIKELIENSNYDEYNPISINQVPINMFNAGIFFKNFFGKENYFRSIKNEHTFQSLTESNKEGCALRKGIYLSKVEQKDDGIHYNLLRCSSNLDGPTDNFRNTDINIINKINETCQYFFTEKVELNHVLAQIYENSDQGKAKIKAHSDKTKDMSDYGLIAFCTFYDGLDELVKNNKVTHDYYYKNCSILTRLYFKLKNAEENKGLQENFSVTLYPNSVFIIPLSTNRLYTHEIKPSPLSHDLIPTRMGYVIRCSKTKAIYNDGVVYINEQNNLTKLENITDENISELRGMYYNENTSDKLMEYGKINYSMNLGDYVRPIL